MIADLQLKHYTRKKKQQSRLFLEQSYWSTFLYYSILYVTGGKSKRNKVVVHEDF